ncbi:hypothetical protein [Streptomyces gougerotii]|uniref:hypothetical protein n=1 Tax=Streptomyces gougerotii TaxID=53448 RepID=UPI001E2BC445|nr:hypothetical protein [Streptomyces gougerotii]
MVAETQTLCLFRRSFFQRGPRTVESVDAAELEDVVRRCDRLLEEHGGKPLPKSVVTGDTPEVLDAVVPDNESRH